MAVPSSYISFHPHPHGGYYKLFNTELTCNIVGYIGAYLHLHLHFGLIGLRATVTFVGHMLKIQKIQIN